jgi:hypothetical protein
MPPAILAASGCSLKELPALKKEQIALGEQLNAAEVD